MKIYKLKALCIAILGVSTKANDMAGVIRMKMRRVRNDRDQPIWGMSVAIAPIEQSEFHVMAFSLDHSNNVDETLDRCLKSSSLYEPERRDDETDLLNFDIHGVACWKISSAFKAQLFEKNKLMDNEEEENWSILDSDEFLRLGVKGVYIIEQTTSVRENVVSFRSSNADESNYVSESDLVLSKVKFSVKSFPKQKVEIRFGDGMVQLPEKMYAVFLHNLEESNYKISNDHRYESLHGKGTSVLSLTDSLRIPKKTGICIVTPFEIDVAKRNRPARVVPSGSDALVLSFAYLQPTTGKIGIDTTCGTKKYNFFCEENSEWRKQRELDLEKHYEEVAKRAEKRIEEYRLREGTSNRRRIVSGSTMAAESSRNGGDANQEEIELEVEQTDSDED